MRIWRKACLGVKDYLKEQNAIVEEYSMTAAEQKWAGTVPDIMKRTDVSAIITFGTIQLELCGKIKKEGLALGDARSMGSESPTRLSPILKRERSARSESPASIAPAI